MIWLQGESDTGGAAGSYQNNLVSLIDRVRDDFFEGEEAPFVLTRLSDNQYGGTLTAGAQTVVNAQTNIVNLRSNVVSIDTDDDLLFTTYPGSTDQIHFDANGQINLGNALGAEMVSLDDAMTPPQI